MILGLVAPDEGKIYFDGTDVTHLPMYQRARLGMGYLPQEASIFRDLTVRENLSLVLEEHGHPRKEQRGNFRESCGGSWASEGVGCKGLCPQRGRASKGGDRPVSCGASGVYFFWMSPSAALTPIAVYEIQQIIRRLRKKGYGILLTDHNVRETLAITDRACIIHQGTGGGGRPSQGGGRERSGQEVLSRESGSTGEKTNS